MLLRLGAALFLLAPLLLYFRAILPGRWPYPLIRIPVIIELTDALWDTQYVFF
jgi:hypothetical protein